MGLSDIMDVMQATTPWDASSLPMDAECDATPHDVGVASTQHVLTHPIPAMDGCFVKSVSTVATGDTHPKHHIHVAGRDVLGHHTGSPPQYSIPGVSHMVDTLWYSSTCGGYPVCC